VAWRYRKSKRLPLGFRMNFSKTGLGFSWGFRGFRIGRDSKGRTIRTVSIPGTGIYNRQVIAQSQHRRGQIASPNVVPSPTRSSFVFFVFLFLLIFLCELWFGAFRLAVGTSILGGLICFGMIRQIKAEAGRLIPTRAAANPAYIPDSPLQQESRIQNHPTYAQTAAYGPFEIPTRKTIDSLVYFIKSYINEVELPLKEELHKYRSAGAARDLLEGDIQKLIVRSGFDGVKLSKEAVDLYLSISRCLHPRRYGALTLDTMADVLNRMTNSDVTYYFPLDVSPVTLKYIQDYDSANGTQFAVKARMLFLKVAECAAVENGVVSAAKEQFLSKLKSACEGSQQG
jgi:hypothetical protein